MEILQIGRLAAQARTIIYDLKNDFTAKPVDMHREPIAVSGQPCA
jgi:hypothetical protein